MSDGSIETPAAGAAPELNEAEQASVALGQAGFSEAPPIAAPASDVPAGVPAKFVKDGKVDYAALTASYVELEKKQGAAPAAVAETPTAAEAAPTVDANGKIVKPAAAEEPSANPLTSILDLARTDFESTQGFSEETAAKLVEAGIPAEVQAVYLAGLDALGKQNEATIHGYAGGAENYSAMATWAASTLTDAELDAFNDSLENPGLRENAVRGLFARYQTARPSEGQQITPVNAGASAGDVYKSRDELLKDQKDPRYGTDSSFRQTVMEKLGRSQAGGFRVSPQPTFSGGYVHRR